MNYGKLLMPMITAALVFPACRVTGDDKPTAKTEDDVARVAALIDRHTARGWKRNNVTPAPVADDAEFLRRAYLHIVGRIPRASEAYAFLADDSPMKRRKLVEELLESPGYITHFTTFWRKVLIPEANADLQARFLIPGFDAWLRNVLRKDVRYDEMVKQLINVDLDRDRQRRRSIYTRFGRATPEAFFRSKQAMPENIAAGVSRMFLGVRLECAQCHDHPFDTWKQEQFWSFAAFFAGIERSGDNAFSSVREVPDRREIAIPGSNTVVQAKYLTGKQPQWRFRTGARETLANWIVSKENPWFAKAAVNRIWGKLFGIGIVDPVDDFSANNPASHPKLLDALAAEFADHDFDVKFLMKAIMASKTYQLTSRRTDESQSNPRLFSRMSVQGLTSEQLFNSLATAVGHYVPYRSQNPFVLRRQDARGEILELFDNNSEPPTERTMTILQALAMMNGEFVADATSLQKSRTLAAVIDMPLLSTEQRIETLYLATLTRKPTKTELARFVKYVDSGGPTNDSDRALADVFWVLLNSSEFLLNH